ncbi:MAG TPA: glycosyltransferase [Mycobacteriales bacterium]|nr:glycosyltransferase [Mycobacteriales bacterium]
MAAPRVSVAVSTYRRPDRIERLLHALAGQTLPATDFDVVIYDDASGDRTPDVIRQLIPTLPFPVRLLEGATNRGPASGRNEAWRAATAAVIAFTDDDCVPQPEWLRAGLGHFSDPDVVAVVGRVEPAPDQHDLLGPYSRTLSVHDARFFATANCLYRRAALEASGGFDERFRRAAGEDTDLGLRILAEGGRADYAEDAVVHHDIRASELRASAREAWSKWIDLALVVRKHPQIRRTLLYRRVFWKPSHAFLLLAIAAGIAAGFWPWAALAALPYLDYRIRRQPLAGRLRRVTTFPGAVLLDVLELATMLRSTLHYRTLIL